MEPSLNEAYRSLEVQHKTLQREHANLKDELEVANKANTHLKKTVSGLQKKLREMRSGSDSSQ